MNIEELSLRELQDLQRKVTKAIETYQDRMKREALAAVQEKAREMGFSIEELLGVKIGKSGKASAPAKYQHPENSSLTWSGRGRRPEWFNAALESGVTEEQLLLK